MLKKRTPKKSLKDEVYHIIRNDIPLRAKIAIALNIESHSVYVAAKRKSAKLGLPFILKIISEHLAKPEDSILENEL